MVATLQKLLRSFLTSIVIMVALLSSAGAEPGFRPLRFQFADPLRQRLQNSVVRLQIATATTSARCSGILISNQGHILTSLHCLAAVLQERNEARLITFANPGTFLELIHAVQQNVLMGVTAFSSRSESLGHLELVAVGPGSFINFPHLGNIVNPRGTASFVSGTDIQLMQNRAGDFAILKLNDLNSNHFQTCLPLAEFLTVPQGQKVFSLGYPLAARRARGSSTNGMPLVVSRGVVLRGFEENPWALEAHLSAVQMQTLNTVALPRGVRLTDLDAVAGSSGSAVVNESGELVAIVSLSVSTARTYAAGLTYIYEVARLRELLLQSQGATATAEIFNCTVAVDAPMAAAN